MSQSSAEEQYPLTPLQEGMLFHSLQAEHPGVDIQQMVWHLEECVEPEALRQAWQEVIQRHAVLRTAFRWSDGNEPRQEVQPQADLSWDEHDWTHLPADEQKKRFEAYLHADRQRGFQLHSPPLMRVALFQRGEHRFDLCWTLHHILLDGRCHALLVREVFDAYDAILGGIQWSPSPPRPYRQYVDWRQEQDERQAEPYWRNLLEGFRDPTPMPTCVPPPASPAEGAHGETALHLSTETTTALQDFAERIEVTLNTLLQAAWALLLSRYSGHKDVVFGATRSCRHGTIPEAGSVVGLFINTLPVRVVVDPDAELISWIQALRKQHLAIRPHEHTTLSRVQEWSEVARGTPLFESLVVYEHQTLEDTLRQTGDAWRSRRFSLHEQTNFPLTLGAWGGDRMRLQLGYDAARYDVETAGSLLEGMHVLLRAFTSPRIRRLKDLTLLSPVQEHRMLVEWNARTVGFPQDQSLHRLFEKQVARDPQKVAVVFEGRSLSYQELNERANRLAHRLREEGVMPETLVGICVERSLDMMVGLLGILKAGGAYVPLNPDDPAERQALMLEDARVPVLLIQEHLSERLPATEATVIRLDADEPMLAGQPAENLPDGARAEHLAYVIYTSGSTGRPKGVMVAHRNAVGFLHSFGEVTQDVGNRISTNIAPCTFDTSVEEFWSPLCLGGTVHIVRPELSTDAAYFARYLIEHGITTSYILPVMLTEVAQHLEADRDRLTLKCLLTGLQAKQEKDLQPYRELSPALRIVNGYGPTETTYGATAFVFEKATHPDREVPIGVPFPNYQVYVVDTDNQPVPVGVAGEILIGGVGVARGYLNRPELTRERFIPSPFDAEPEARLYRSGDRGRFRSDGNIEFLGRIDEQVKVRGYRVETGEVETAFSQHEAVRQCVVVAVKEGAGDHRLVAYVVWSEGAVPAVNELRQFLRTKLPDYMIPRVVIGLEQLPLTTSGKVDRNALPSSGQEEPETACVYVAPRTEAERTLTTIWEAVLEREKVGVHDNFFDLGGHSLLAMRVVARIRSSLGVEVPIRSFFQAPTIESLVRMLGPEEWNPTWSSLVPLRPHGSQPPFFFVHGLGGDVYVFMPLTRCLAEDQPIYGFQAVEGRHTTVEEMAAHYVSEMRSFQPEGPYYLGGYSLGGWIAYEVARQLSRQGQQVNMLAMLETNPSGVLPPLLHLRGLVFLLQQRLLFHLSRFFTLPRQERLDYFRQRWVALRHHFGGSRRRPLPTPPTAGEPIPALSVEEREDRYKRATASYRPLPYPGTVDLFQSGDGSPFAIHVLQKMARGGVRLHHVPGAHLTLIDADHAPAFARVFEAAIEHARQSKDGPNQPTRPSRP